MRNLTTAGLAAAAGLAVLAAGAIATTPGDNGRLAFRRYLNADQTASAFYTMKPDGSDMRQISRSPKHAVDDQPDWSPDGTKLAFYRVPSGPNAVWVMNADGSESHQVTPHCSKGFVPHRVPVGCEDASEPSFGPDGTHVTYVRSTGRVRSFPKYEYEQV